MESLVNELIKYFMMEASHPLIDIPNNYVNKREFLRGLLNVREPKMLPIEIINKENELLQRELENKKIISEENFDKGLSLYQGDITCIKCDAIINPTDSKMLGCFIPNHNCISNKIHSGAGISLRLKCFEITKGSDIETSKVIMTEGFNLPCKYIIHTVKPTISFLDEKTINDIVLFYRNSLEMASKNNIKSICVPNLKAPFEIKEEVSRIIINTIKEFMKNNNQIEKIIFDVYTLDDYNIYSKIII